MRVRTFRGRIKDRVTEYMRRESNKEIKGYKREGHKQKVRRREGAINNKKLPKS